MLIITIVLTAPVNTFAQEPELKQEQQQNEQLSYTQQKWALLEEAYANPEYISLIDIDKATIKLEDLSKSFTKIEEEYAKNSEERTEIEEKYGNVQQSINRILNDTARNKELVVDTLTKISLLKKKIQALKQSIVDTQDDIEKSSQDLQEYTRFLYYLYNDYYGRWSSDTTVSLLIKSDNLAESLSTNDSLVILTGHLQTLLDAMKQKQRDYLTTIHDVNKAQIAYTQAWLKLKDELDMLDQQKASLYELLSYLQSTKDIADTRISDLRASQDELSKQISSIKNITQWWLKVKEWSVASQLLAKKDKEDSDSYFTWPVLWAPFIGRYFHDEYYFKDKWEKFDGVRFEVPQRSEVYSAAPGVVYKVVHNDDMSLSWIVLLHKYGYATFYSPLHEVFVEEWTLVWRGELIGLSWGQPWTTWAWLDTDWPRLDFSVKKNWDAFDPLLWLDISIYEKKEALPEAYHTKYIKNLYERDVVVDMLWTFTSETIAERRDEFLNLYAVWPFADAALWEDAAAQSWIDPIFGMCIWFAETSFKNFKTVNNIWNVWNDDRGRTREFSSPLAWAKALFGVFNNQYLWDYNTLNELSRYGNRDGFIYASSPYNRQKNIMNCLSSVYWYRVQEDFPIRRRVK